MMYTCFYCLLLFLSFVTLMLARYSAHQKPMEFPAAGEVSLDETCEVSPGVHAYAISAFFYKIADNTLKTTQCFQVVYTRKPDPRPGWFSFPPELHVSC